MVTGNPNEAVILLALTNHKIADFGLDLPYALNCAGRVQPALCGTFRVVVGAVVFVTQRL